MNLRIYRTFTWELACNPSEVRLGGTNPMKLVAHDTVQYNSNQGAYGEPIWVNVDIIEAEKPEHPNKKKLKLGYGNLDHNLYEDRFKSK